MKPSTKNCAIYTRKSTEEGLEQDFNSLDAQREACAAYIASQKGEGWQLVPKVYDDGGFSGGTMERPALQQLLADIIAGKVDIIVVYKIDRLTRSLMDFAKLVDVFDTYNVTFVSVTQSFNTTTSMGRLTLNVLLSFAQFEREVTGERIRDKLAASKKRGMWMGGVVPMGYVRKDRSLEVDPKTAKLVQSLYTLYLQLGTVKKLKQHLDAKNIRTPLRCSKKGVQHGGAAFSVGHLYHVLRNPIYIGKVSHKNELYDGMHPATIDENLFKQVQQQLENNKLKRKEKNIKSGSILQGLLFDADGVPYSPTYTSKKGKRYCYYISQNLLQYKDHPKGVAARLPAFEIEQTVLKLLESWLSTPERIATHFPESTPATQAFLQNTPLMVDATLLRAVLIKAELQQEQLSLTIDAQKLQMAIQDSQHITLGHPQEETLLLYTTFKTHKANNGAIVIAAPCRKSGDPFDLPPEDLQRIVRGAIWQELHFNGMTMECIAAEVGHSHNTVRQCIHAHLAFISA